MLTLTIGGEELYDEENERFITNPSVTLKLEHSLLSVSEWESKWKKRYLNNDDPHTIEETIDYIRCMTINKDVDPAVYNRLTRFDLQKIEDYIADKRTATWFRKEEGKGNKTGELVTSELIYYWMIASNIPFECERWHLNRLLTLIRICEIKNSPAKKMSKKDLYAQNRALNAKRKARRK